MAQEKIIVFGLSGLVGNVMQKELSHKYNLINLSLETGTDISKLPCIRHALAKHKDALAVINLAAATDTNKAWSDLKYQSLCHLVNSLGAKNIAQVCQEQGFYGVQVSTDYVFSGQKTKPYLETDPLDPIEPYGQTKADGETAAISYGMSVATLAFPYTRNPVRGDAITKIVDQLKSGNPIKAFADQYLTPTLIEDFVRGLEQMVVRRAPGKYFIVGSSSETPFSLRQKIAQVLKISDINITPTSVHQYNQSAVDTGSRPFQPNLSLINKKMSETLELNSSTFEQGLNIISR